MFRAILALAALFSLSGCFLMGAGYTRDVAKSQAEVMAALEDLDITAQPGAPGSTAAAAGGIKPAFRLEKAADHMTWYVMNGEQVATTMTATFTPIDGGKGTRVVASVRRGDAPDDAVSPAFRSNGLTLGLFGMALEGELNKLTAPPPGDPVKCQEMRDRLLETNAEANIGHDRPHNLMEAIGEGAKATMKLNAWEQQLRAAGCWKDTNPNEFRPVSQEMRPAEAEPSSMPTPAMKYEPGKPMLDPTPH